MSLCHVCAALVAYVQRATVLVWQTLEESRVDLAQRAGRSCEGGNHHHIGRSATW